MADEKNDDYEVGYRKPPKHSRFRPGQSGNPRGRPQGSKNFKTEFMEEMNERIPVVENGRRRKIPKRRAFVKRLLEKALNGDVRAMNVLVMLELRLFADKADEAADAPLVEDERELLDLLQARALKRASGRGQPKPKST